MGRVTTVKKIHKICIANRGEIAIRIARAAKLADIKTLALYSEDESDAAHIMHADEAASLGGGALSETYLNQKKIIALAIDHGCQALHPGYGFLAENADFAEACEKAGLIFIGPAPKIIRLMGNKLQAREFVQNIGAPVTPGMEGSPEDLLAKADELDYPVLIKAAAGGGGKGMQLAENKDEFIPALEQSSREALSYFGDGTVYVEKFFSNPRHIEVQILGDQQGNVIHLFERDCSIQRRYQKIIEEAPAPGLPESVRSALHDSALEIARAASYFSAGTIEFLLDRDGKHYFLEMNTRIQVEHPVTEMITGVDIVLQQIRVAEGHELGIDQKDLKIKGHAVECRVYAENIDNNFLPSPGTINFYREPLSENFRIDSSIEQAMEVKSQYDPMISKVITHGKDRKAALEKMQDALADYKIYGIKTNIAFLSTVLDLPDFRAVNYSTKYIENNLSDIISKLKAARKKEESPLMILAALIYSLQNTYNSMSIWNEIGWWRANSQMCFLWEGKEILIENLKLSQSAICFTLNDKALSINAFSLDLNEIELISENEKYNYCIFETEPGQVLISSGLSVFEASRPDILGDKVWESEEEGSENLIKSQMPGKIIKLSVNDGDWVKKGDELLIMEAMKMESSLRATHDARVKKVHVETDQQVQASELLIELEVEDEK